MTVTKPSEIRVVPDRVTVVADDLPPVRVTRDDIPAVEHVPEHVPQSVIDEQVFRRRARILIAVEVVLCVALAVVSVLLYAWSQPATSPATHQGLGAYAWQQYRADERAPGSVAAAVAPVLVSPFTGQPVVGAQPF